MMSNRLKFQEFLEDLLGNDQVYYQPPESTKMKYPAIVYSMAKVNNQFSNNHVYIQKTAYRVTVIDKDPDSEIAEKFYTLPLCEFDRSFSSDNLNHFIFTLYY